MLKIVENDASRLLGPWAKRLHKHENSASKRQPVCQSGKMRHIKDFLKIHPVSQNGDIMRTILGLCISVGSACCLMGNELIVPDKIKPIKQSGNVEIRNAQGATLVRLQGKTPEVNNSPRNMYLNYMLELPQPISLEGKSLKITASIPTLDNTDSFYVRAFNEGEKTPSWSFSGKAGIFKKTPSSILVTAGRTQVMKWESKVANGKPADRIRRLQFFVGTNKCNVEMMLDIHSIQVLPAPSIKDDNPGIGFSANTEFWDKVTSPCPIPANTALFKDGKAIFDIICPDTATGKAEAEAIASACQETAGARPPILPGSLALRVPKRTCLMLGNIFNNPAMQTLYTRGAIVADSIWPGPAGHVLRTVFEPFQRDIDVIALEASDDEGLKAARVSFITLLKYKLKDGKLPKVFQFNITNAQAKMPDFKDNHVAEGLKGAQKVLNEGKHTSLGGYLADIASRYRLWQNPADAKLYAEVAKLYRKSAVADPRKFGGPWGFDSDFPSYQAIAGWDMIEHDTILTDDDRMEVCQTILQWLNQAIAKEALGGLRGKGVVSNHLTFASLGMMMGALYFKKAYPEFVTPDDWIATANHNFRRQNDARKAMDDCDSYHWLTWRHVITHAMAMPDDTIFNNGIALNALDVCGVTMDNMGAQSPYGDDSGWCSSGSENIVLNMLYAARQFPLAATLLSLKRPRQNTTGIGNFYGQAVFTNTTQLDGLRILPLEKKYMDSVSVSGTVPPFERCFDKMSFRDKLAPDAFYALVDGLNNGGHRHEDANSVLRMSIFNRNWLMENEYIKSQQKFHNSLLMLMNGEAFSLPDYMEIVSSGENTDMAWAFVRANDFGPADWTRRFLWLKSENAFVVIDELLAKKSGQYQIRQRWNGLGECTVKNDGMQLTQMGPSLRIQCLGNMDFSIREDENLGKGWENYKYAKPLAHVLDQTYDDTIAEGQKVVLGALFHGNINGDTLPWNFLLDEQKMTIETGKTAHTFTLPWSNDGSISHTSKPSVKTISEPAPRAAKKSESLTARELQMTMNTVIRNFIGKDKAVCLTAPENRQYFPVTITGDAPTSPNVFNNRLANELSSAMDGEGVGIEDSVMYEPNQKVSIDITLPAPNPVTSVVCRLWWASTSSKKTAYKLQTARLKLSTDGTDFFPAATHEVPPEETHPNFGKPFSFSLTPAEVKNVKALRLEFTPQPGTAIYINEIKVMGHVPKDQDWPTLYADISRSIPITTKEGKALATTTRKGNLVISTLAGKTLNSFDLGTQINDIASTDVDGDGQPELLLACNDWTLKAVKLDGTILWSHLFQFYRRPAFCTIVRVADLDGNGTPVILAGCENWRTYALDLNGKELWNFEVVHPTRAVEVADLNGDGKPEILCGTRYCYATVLDNKGSKLWGCRFGRGCKGMAAALAGDGQRTMLVGGDEGRIDFYRPIGKLIKVFATGDEVRMAQAIPRTDTKDMEDLVAGSGNGFAYRFAPEGNLLWCKYLASPVYVVRAFPNGHSVFGTAAGLVAVFDPQGKITAQRKFKGAISDIRVLEDNSLLISTEHGELAILK